MYIFRHTYYVCINPEGVNRGHQWVRNIEALNDPIEKNHVIFVT